MRLQQRGGCSASRLVAIEQKSHTQAAPLQTVAQFNNRSKDRYISQSEDQSAASSTPHRHKAVTSTDILRFWVDYRTVHLLQFLFWQIMASQKKSIQIVDLTLHLLKEVQA